MFRLRTLMLAALPLIGLTAGTAQAGWIYHPNHHPIVVVRPGPIVVAEPVVTVAAVPVVTPPIVTPVPVATLAPEVIVRPPLFVAPRVYYRHWR